MLKNDDKSRAPSTGGQLLMLEEEKKFFAENNNFIDYFLEIGVKPDIFSNNKITPNSKLYDINSNITPVIISKFPYFEKKSMGIDDSIIKFIFPHGFQAELKAAKPEPYFYSLILDNQFYSSVYSYKYIACLLIYESLNIYKKIYDSYSNDDSKSNNNSKVPQDSFKNIYIPKCLCLASVHPSINKFESILRAIYSHIQMSKNYFLDLVIEKLVSQTPKIPRGLKKVYLKFSEKNLIELTERKMNELITVDINLKELFATFKIDKIVDIFKYLLYEIKTVFFGSKINQVTNTIMCFLLLLKPFTYQCQILSVLHQDFYYLLETDNPWIFGVNEQYFKSFFENKNLNVEDSREMLIVDIDKKDYYLTYAGGQVKGGAFPSIPKHLREKLDKRTEEYKKNKKKEETNEGYQEIFYRFMINLLKDYPKFLKKDYNGKSRKLLDMFDKDAFLSMQSNSDREFYEKIVKSQMFEEFIFKRMRPKDQRDKIQALFFEEKLNVKQAQKKFIGGSKILTQNVLLPSKEYDYKEPKEIIDLSESGLFSRLNENTINFFYQPNINKKECLPRGFCVREGGSKGQLLFDYYIFPGLLSEKLFKYNCKNYIVPTNIFYRKMEDINNEIIHFGLIKFDENKKNFNIELLNDVYLSYLILFALTFWYTDKEEREYRFNNMMQVLDKIEYHNIEVIELLFNSLFKLGEDDFAILLHTQYLNLHLNPTTKIFSIMSKVLKNKQSIYAESKLEKKKSNRSSMRYGNRSMVYTPKKNIDTKIFRTRTIKLPGIDDDILGEQVLFDAYGICLDCKGIVNIEKICTELNVKDIDKDNRFKGTCKCNNWCLQKINFKIGTELYNKTISLNNSSCVNQGIILYSPTTLKKKLLEISNLYSDTTFDVEKFRINYPDEFWNAIWYFELKGIDVSFMLPYLKPNQIKILNTSNKINKYIEFVTLEQQSKGENQEKIPVHSFKNPNNIISKNEQKSQKNYIKFNKDLLFIQHAYQLSIINIIGMIMYKSPDTYTENIGFNEKLLVVTKKENNNKYNDYEEKKSIKEKKKKSNLSLNNINSVEFDLSNLNNSISTIMENEEYNKLWDGNIKIDENINANNNKNKENNKNSSKVHFSNEELFETMKDDDINYHIIYDYKEDDGSYDSEY
jgi:hypothetical protein